MSSKIWEIKKDKLKETNLYTYSNFVSKKTFMIKILVQLKPEHSVLLISYIADFLFKYINTGGIDGLWHKGTLFLRYPCSLK